MSYRIEYDASSRKYEIAQKRVSRILPLTAIYFSLFLVMTLLFWPEGAAVLRDAVIPGEDTQTLNALECMAENLREGASLTDAFSGFCREILHGTGTY